MRQRGFAWVKLAAVAAVIALAWAGFAWHASMHFSRGEASKQAEWDKSKLAAIAAGRARDQDVSDAVKEQEARGAAADARAALNQAKWEDLRRANRNASLGRCAPVRPAAPADGTVGEGGAQAAVPGSGLRAPRSAGADRVADPGVRLSWRFIGLHDGAFTGIDGQPLFGDSARFALDPARADADSPYGLEDAVDVGGANAKALNTCRRAYFKLRGELVAAEAAHDRRRR